MSARATRRDFPLPACGERVARTVGPSRVRGRATQHRRERNAPHPTSSLCSDVDLSPLAGRGEREQGELLAMGTVLNDAKDGTINAGFVR